MVSGQLPPWENCTWLALGFGLWLVLGLILETLFISLIKDSSGDDENLWRVLHWGMKTFFLILCLLEVHFPLM